MKKIRILIVLLGIVSVMIPRLAKAQDYGTEEYSTDDNPSYNDYPDDTDMDFNADDYGNTGTPYTPGTDFTWYVDPNQNYTAYIQTDSNYLYTTHDGIVVSQSCKTYYDASTDEPIGQECSYKSNYSGWPKVDTNVISWSYSVPPPPNNSNPTGAGALPQGIPSSGNLSLVPDMEIGGVDISQVANWYSGTGSWTISTVPATTNGGADPDLLRLHVQFSLRLPANGINTVLNTTTPSYQFSLTINRADGMAMATFPLEGGAPDANGLIPFNATFTLPVGSANTGAITSWHNQVVIIEIDHGIFDSSHTTGIFGFASFYALITP